MNPSRKPAWRKSSASGASNCVEVRFVEQDGVLLRNSRLPEGPIVRFTLSEWDAFLAGVQLGEFDKPELLTGPLEAGRSSWPPVCR
jgi:hypothetical protein